MDDLRKGHKGQESGPGPKGRAIAVRVLYV